MNNPSVEYEQRATIKRAIFVSLGVGIMIGAFLIFSPGTLFIVILATICGFFILKYLPASERNFVKWIFIIGLIVRMIVAVSLDVAALARFKAAAMQKVEEKNPSVFDYRKLIKEKTRSFFKMGDSDYYSMRGYVYAAHAKGLDNIIIRTYLGPYGLEYGRSAYLYIIGLFYYLFDYSPVAVKFLNCLIGVLVAVFIYKIGLKFNRQVARIAFLLAVFMPTLIMWSTANLKEPTIILISGMSIWTFIVFLETRDKRYLIASILGIVSQALFSDSNLWLILLVPLALAFLFMLSWPKKALLVLLAAICFVIFAPKIEMRNFSLPHAVIKELYIKHVGHINTGGFTYRVLNDQYYKNAHLLSQMGLLEFIHSATKSLIHFLFEPFPNRLSNSFFLLIYGQIVLWYLLVFFSCVGFIRGRILNRSAYFVLFLYVVIGSGALALVSGNIGTLIRHRDIISPFYFVFAAIGLTSVFGLKRARNESFS